MRWSADFLKIGVLAGVLHVDRGGKIVTDSRVKRPEKLPSG